MNQEFLKALFYELFQLENEKESLNVSVIPEERRLTHGVLISTNKIEIDRIERIIKLYTKTHISWPA